MQSNSVIRQPRNVTETGLPPELIKQLLLKHLYDGVVLDIQQLRTRLKLAGNILETILQELRNDQRLQAHSASDGSSGVRFQLTELGKADAANAVLKNGYLGPAPITLNHYQQLMLEQSVFNNEITQQRIYAEFENVVIEKRHLDVLGPAMHSGRPLLVYGQAGTGKTYISKKMAALLLGTVYLPYSIAVGHEIIQLYDPLVHQQAAHQTIDNQDNQLTEFDSLNDPRLVECNRPVVISGGELTMDRLEIGYDPVARTSHAPIQMKANNGIYIIDDMGRQRMPPAELFNRWIVPMEERQDFLTLHTGKHFSVPFDCILIFSTNLHPSDLADEAFLRRLGYKIHFTPINESQFTEIWNNLITIDEIQVDDHVLNSLFDRYRNTERVLLPCHPRDLMGIALDLAAYQGQPNTVSQQNTLLAWDTYFVNLK